MPPIGIGNYVNITGQGNSVVKTGTGVLYSITLNNPVATEVITLFDNTAGSGTKIGTITIPTSPMPVTLFYNTTFNTGLVVTTATASSDITVNFR